jgi:hypothetical protein
VQCLVLDQTVSCTGPQGVLLTEAASVFAMALARLGLDTSTAIITFGQRVRLLKPLDVKLDARFIYRMLTGTASYGNKVGKLDAQ